MANEKVISKGLIIATVIVAIIGLLISNIMLLVNSENGGDFEETTSNFDPAPAPVETIIVTETVTMIETQVITELVPVIERITVPPDDYFDIKGEIESNKSEQAAHLAACAEKYPTATAVWVFLTQNLGYNHHVAAGIIGNMMNECGGNTLNLRWNEYGGSKGYYGLCMWSMKYHPNLGDASIEAQLEYLASSIEGSFKTWGKLYKVGFTYENFCDLTSAEAAAEAFMKVYERPGPSSLETRKRNALRAYEFFVGE